MSDVPEAAVEAAAKAMFGQEQCDRRQMLDLEGNWESRLNEQDQADYRDIARAAIEAAMPAIREAIAQEIEAAGRADVEWLATNRKDKLDMGRLIGSEDAWKDALSIVRGGTQ